jgi:hypothetical protein
MPHCLPPKRRDPLQIFTTMTTMQDDTGAYSVGGDAVGTMTVDYFDGIDLIQIVCLSSIG